MDAEDESRCAENGSPWRAEVSRRLQELLSHAAIARLNFEFISKWVEGEAKAALDDAQTSVDRVVETAKAVQDILQREANDRANGP